MAEDPRRRLGRGLSALLGDEEEDYADLDKAAASRSVAIENLTSGRFQPRQNFDADELSTLADSIRSKGILQPIVVRRLLQGEAEFEIIAGERRWRAAQLAELRDVPVLVRELSDQDALEIALIENLQRENLNAVEEAHAYQRLMDEFAHSQEALAKTVGRSRSHVANMMRLLTLPDAVQALIVDGSLSAGHARTLIGAAEPEAAAAEIVARGLSVRQAEALAQAGRAPKKRGPQRTGKDPDTLALEHDLSGVLGLKVSIRPRGPQGRSGSLTIEYGSLDQLDDVLQRLSRGGSPGGRHTAENGDVLPDVHIPAGPKELE